MPNPEATERLSDQRRIYSHQITAGETMYIAPNKKHYPDKFLWDTCLIMSILDRMGNADTAAELMPSLLSSMDKKTGFIPNMVFLSSKMGWSPERRLNFEKGAKHSDYTQPPIMAESAWETYEAFRKRGQSDKGRQFLMQNFPDLKLAYGYFLETSDKDKGDYLAKIDNPHASGMDYLPIYENEKLPLVPLNGHKTWNKIAKSLNTVLIYADRLHTGHKKDFSAKDVAFNCLYARNLSFMSRIARELGEEKDERHFSALANKVGEQILEKFWNEEKKMFFPIVNGESKEIITVSSLYPIILTKTKPEQVEVIVNALEDKKLFNTNYPIPSVPRNSDKYDPSFEIKLIWRGGGTWPSFVNVFIAEGLARQSARQDLDLDLRIRTAALAINIANKNRELFEIDPVPREFYNPETGEGLRKKTVPEFVPSLFGKYISLEAIPEYIYPLAEARLAS